jgi:hypothetical protein
MRFHACGLIAFPQFIYQVLEIRGGTGAIRAKHLLKSLAHGLAD